MDHAELDSKSATARFRGPAAERDTTRRWGRVDSVVMTAYLAIAAAKLAAHPMWRDELQSWDLARSSDGLGQVLLRVRYEKHPPGWYLLLWLWSRISPDPRMLQVLAWLLVAVTAAIVVRFAPWPRPLRWLVLAGYYPLFEWSTIARPYLLVFLLAIVAAELVRRGRVGLPFGLVLAALVMTDDAYGTALAFALLGAAVAGRGGWRAWRGAAGLATVALGAAAALSVSPADYGGPTLGLSGSSVVMGLTAPLHAFLPVPTVSTLFWNTWLVDGLGPTVVAVGGLTVTVLLGWLLRRDRRAQVLWAVGVVAVSAVQVLTALPYARFVGADVVVMLCAFWVHGPLRPDEQGRLTNVFRLLLALQTPGAVVALAETSLHPFSQSQAAGAMVATLPGTVIAVRDEAAVPVSAYAGRPLDLVDGQPGPASFVVWDTERLCADRRCTVAQLTDEAVLEAQTKALAGPTYVLTDFPLTFGAHPQLRLIHDWTGSVVDEEDFWLYEYMP